LHTQPGNLDGRGGDRTWSTIKLGEC